MQRDFVFDALANGRRVETLTVVDDCSKEAVKIAPSGYPGLIRTDSGAEFAGRTVAALVDGNAPNPASANTMQPPGLWIEVLRNLGPRRSAVSKLYSPAVNRICLNQAPLEAAIVDLDGTMVDTVGDFEVALGAALADVGWPAVSRAFIARTVGKGSQDLIACTLAEVGAPPMLFDEVWARYQHHYLKINGQNAAVFPGVVEGLVALKSLGWRLACLTNKPGAFARPLLERKGLAGFFDKVFGGDDFERKKPDPLPLLETCAALGTEPARTLMVGDSSNDALAARAAGCPVVLLSYGYNHGEPASAAGADAVLDSLSELPGLLLDFRGCLRPAN